MKAILQRYVGKEVGINLYKPFNIDTFTIDVVEDNYITVSNQENSNLIHIPFQNVTVLREGWGLTDRLDCHVPGRSGCT